MPSEEDPTRLTCNVKEAPKGWTEANFLKPNQIHFYIFIASSKSIHFIADTFSLKPYIQPLLYAWNVMVILNSHQI